MPISLSKAGLIERVAIWARRRSVEFTATRLNEWIKQGLVWEGLRDPNEGKRPVYRYGCRHYRRVLQLVRLHSNGIRDRDAILIQLFLKGYGVQPHETRDALWREFRWARSRLNATLRSTRFDDDRPIPPKHKESMIRSGGEPDKRLSAAGIVPDPDVLIAAARAARSPDPEGASRKADFGDLEKLARDLLSRALGGWLVDDPAFPSEMEKLILRATDEQYEVARASSEFVRSMWLAGSSAGAHPTWGPAIQAYLQSYDVREFASFHLVLGLMFAEKLKNSVDSVFDQGDSMGG